MISSSHIILIAVVVIVIILSINQKYFNSFNKLYKTLSKIPKVTMLVVAVLALFSIKVYNPFHAGRLNINDLLGTPDFNETERNHIKGSKKETNEYENDTESYSGTQKVKRHVTESTKKIVAANQQWKCAICGCLLDETYEVDHIVPLYKGGSNDINNLMALDPICHRKKTNADRLDIPIKDYFNTQNTKFCEKTKYYNNSQI